MSNDIQKLQFVDYNRNGVVDNGDYLLECSQEKVEMGGREFNPCDGYAIGRDDDKIKQLLAVKDATLDGKDIDVRVFTDFLKIRNDYLEMTENGRELMDVKNAALNIYVGAAEVHLKADGQRLFDEAQDVLARIQEPHLKEARKYADEGDLRNMIEAMQPAVYDRMDYQRIFMVFRGVDVTRMEPRRVENEIEHDGFCKALENSKKGEIRDEVLDLWYEMAARGETGYDCEGNYVGIPPREQYKRAQLDVLFRRNNHDSFLESLKSTGRDEVFK